MKQLDQFNAKIQFLFSDIDDTISSHGKIHDSTYSSLWQLKNAGVKIIAVTGRPAGWCDMIARFWPVDAVVGENGAFYFKYDEKNKKMHRHYFFDEATRKLNYQKLKNIEIEVLKEVPGTAISADQFSRQFDLAIDFCEDVPALDSQAQQKILDICFKHGAEAKLSSIHVNTWFGKYDKLSMCKTLAQKEYKTELSQMQSQMAFSGDSPNDEPMFEYFDYSFAVANFLEFQNKVKSLPKFICTKEAGEGFNQLANKILENLKA